MNWQKAMEEIQSVEFDVNLNAVSGTNAFFRALAQEPAMLEAQRQMLESEERRDDVLDRIKSLAALEADPRYQNAQDTPLAALLWLIHASSSDQSPAAAAYIDRAQQLRYAKKLARAIRAILDAPPSPDGSNNAPTNAESNKPR